MVIVMLLCALSSSCNGAASQNYYVVVNRCTLKDSILKKLISSCLCYNYLLKSVSFWFWFKSILIRNVEIWWNILPCGFCFALFDSESTQNASNYTRRDRKVRNKLCHINGKKHRSMKHVWSWIWGLIKKHTNIT